MLLEIKLRPKVRQRPIVLDSLTDLPDIPHRPTQADDTKSQGKPPAKPNPAAKASAALKFAPRIRQPKSSIGPSTTYTAEPVFIDTLRPEPPSTASSSSSVKEKKHEVVFGKDGEALAKAPAMTLNAGGGKRERGKEEEQRRKQKKKQRVGSL